MTGKVDAAGNGTSYTYTPGGRLASRMWARGTNTMYYYDNAGNLNGITYNDSATPLLTNSYDRLGRKNSTVCNGTTTTLAYDLANDVLSESYSGGVLNGLSVTNGYDAYLRRTNLTARGSSVLSRAIYVYDKASRLASASDGTNSASYTYLANSPLVGQIAFQQSGTTRMTTTKQYDHLNRLTSMASMPSLANFAYAYDNANQRTRTSTGDGGYWAYTYDSLGQVTSGNKYWADGTPVAGQQFDYAFDNIGNRFQTQAGGDATGANLRLAHYTNNLVNEITSRDVPGDVDVMGIGQATNSVLINGLSPYRKEPYFREQLGVTNSSASVWDPVTAASPGQASVTGHVYVAQTPEHYTYDLDGNLLSDGRWNYTWDGENRLLSMTSLSGAPAGSQLQLNFTYDYMGRRIQKIVSTNGLSGYVGAYTNNYIYDGWNLIAEVTPSGSFIRSYLWGSDISGSMQGAGGVGGLLAVNMGTNGTHFAACDGNGNVAALLNAGNQSVSVTYEYGPFGEVIRATGPMAKLNPFTFGTYFYDWETDRLNEQRDGFRASSSHPAAVE